MKSLIITDSERMMKKIFLLTLLTLLIVLPACAQTEESWTLNFFDDFDDNSFAWPLGSQTSGNTTVSRSIQDSNFVWNIQTSDPNVLWMGVNIEAPAEETRYRYATEVLLPDFDPLACGGLMFGSQNGSFYGYVVCNDKTYSLLKYDGGNVTTLIPYTNISDYDSFSASAIAVEINNGWADLYFGENTLDTYNVGAVDGGFGLIAMPQSTESTDVSFDVLSFQSTAAAQETTFDADAVDANASDSVSRMIKMLNLKERIDSTAGVYESLPDYNVDLAMMGYASKEPISSLTGSDLFLQADISWDSGYEHPDYANAGCGFYIREQDSASYIEIYAAMDGAVYVNAFRNGSKVPLISLNYGSYAVEGSGRLGIAADTQKITILWNDSILGTITDATWVGEGNTGYLIHSGTNGDFGTRCVYTNVEAYKFTE